MIAIFPDFHPDHRGWFARAWCRDEFNEAGISFEWTQANLAHNSGAGTLRGIHLQRAPYAEAKLVRCTRGSLYDVAVDLRRDSVNFGRWVGTVLSADTANALLIPPGFGHGYMTLEPGTDSYYQTSVEYHPSHATGVRFDDPIVGVAWPRDVSGISEQDRSWPLLEERDDV